MAVKAKRKDMSKPSAELPEMVTIPRDVAEVFVDAMTYLAFGSDDTNNRQALMERVQNGSIRRGLAPAKVVDGFVLRAMHVHSREAADIVGRLFNKPHKIYSGGCTFTQIAKGVTQR